MNTDRRILAWLAVAASLLVCGPCACTMGLLTLAGISSYVDPDYPWNPSSTVLFGAFGIITLLATALGLVCLAWGVTTLLHGRLWAHAGPAGEADVQVPGEEAGAGRGPSS